MISFTDPAFLSWVVMPFLIFFARILDVSIGTLRVIFIGKGYKLIAPVLGFFEVTIWLIVITQVMKNMTSPICYIAYGLGFATGTYVGMYIEEKVSIGKVILRIITKTQAGELVKALRQEGYPVTSMNAENSVENVKIIFMIIKRKDVKKVVDIVKEYNPKAFYSIEDVKFAIDNTVLAPASHSKKMFAFLRLNDKSK